jgi:hypothetical protein
LLPNGPGCRLNNTPGAAYHELVLSWMAQRYTLRYSGGLVPDLHHILAKVRPLRLLRKQEARLAGNSCGTRAAEHCHTLKHIEPVLYVDPPGRAGRRRVCQPCLTSRSRQAAPAVRVLPSGAAYRGGRRRQP